MTNKRIAIILLFLLGSIMLLVQSSAAAAPPVSIEISTYGKYFFVREEPIPVQVTVTNTSPTSTLYISEKISDKDYLIYMRVYNPAGGLVLPKAAKLPDSVEAPNRGPLPLHPVTAEEMLPCEAIAGGWTRVVSTTDLRDYYDFNLPGTYSLQVQLSVLSFPGPYCGINALNWGGVLKSETALIVYQGKTEVTYEPSTWLTAWSDPAYDTTPLYAWIWPHAERAVDEFDTRRIVLNGVVSDGVERLWSTERGVYYLKAAFNKNQVYSTLPDPQADKAYLMGLMGYGVRGGHWGGASVITIAGSGPSAPAAPTSLVATAESAGQVSLTWTDNSDNEQGFKIERCAGTGCTFQPLATVAADVTSYSDTDGIAPGTAYSYRVCAYAASNSVWVSSNTVTTPSAPAGPTNLSATATATQVSLTWADNSDNEAGFRILRCTGASCSNFAPVGTVGAGVTSYSDTNVAEGTLYRYEVAAYNTSGDSGPSNISEVTTLTTTIAYAFTGFFPPVDNPPVPNTAKAGQAIPLKWRIVDANGTPVSSAASFKGLSSYSISCTTLSGTASDVLEEYAAAGSSGLQYLGDGYWQYNWKTPTSFANQCRALVLTVSSDNKAGTAQHTANFIFKK